MGRCAVKRTLLWSATVSLFCLLYFIPYKVRADNGADLLNKCASLKNQNTNKTWDKFRAGKDKFKASRKREATTDIKKQEEFSRGYCLGYITANANALSVASPQIFCPPKKITKGELSLIVIEYINENHSNALKLRANQLVTKALLNKFLCHK